MKMIIDVNRMVDESIKFNECLFIYFCHVKDLKLYNFYREQFGSFITKQEVLSLVDRNYLEFIDVTDPRITFSNLRVTSRAKFLLQEDEIETKAAVKEKTNPVDWLEEWYAVFPKGIKSGNYPVRSGLGSCRSKMLKFLKTNKFNKDTIILATKLYVKEMEKVNYSYMQLAKYFIEKDGSSTLEAYCERVLEKQEAGEDIESELDKGYSDSFNTSLN